MVFLLLISSFLCGSLCLLIASRIFLVSFARGMVSTVFICRRTSLVLFIPFFTSDLLLFSHKKWQTKTSTAWHEISVVSKLKNRQKKIAFSGYKGLTKHCHLFIVFDQLDDIQYWKRFSMLFNTPLRMLQTSFASKLQHFPWQKLPQKKDEMNIKSAIHNSAMPYSIILSQGCNQHALHLAYCKAI